MNNLYYKKYTLKKELQKYIKYAWIMKAYEAKSKPDLLIPDGYPEIIFVKKGAYQKTLLSPKKKSSTINQSCIIGIQTQSSLVSRKDNCQLVGLKLQPLGAYMLFGNRLKSILDFNTPLDDFGIKWLSDLDRQVQIFKEDEAIIDLLSKTFSHQIENLEKIENNTLASSFLTSILKINGNTTVKELAHQHHISVRHFQRKFKEYFGVSPKKFLNIIRFKHLYKSSILKQKPPVDFLDYGYYDQMHFIKDFQKHLGISPSKSGEPSFWELNIMAKINS